MKKILLTSAGFDNKNLEKVFLENVGKPANVVKVLFVPTAANDDESKEMLPLCREEIVRVGISPDNIVTYDLDRQMSDSELEKYDAIYFCGGSETYLMQKINEVNFGEVLMRAVENGLFYIGVSAGSMIATPSVENIIGILPNPLEPHCEEDITPCGALPKNNQQINLSDDQAVWIYSNDDAVIID